MVDLLPEELIPFVTEHLTRQFPRTETHVDCIEKMFGQASSRQYFRIFLRVTEATRFNAANSTSIEMAAGRVFPASVVVMKLPGGATSPAEEITKGEPLSELPFLNIQRYLQEQGLLVPAVLGVSPTQDLVLLEDLGDQTLEKLVHDVTNEFKVFYYRKVLDTLVELQMRTRAGVDKNCIAFARSFDADLLNWEFEHFWEYGVIDRLKLQPPQEEARLFQRHTKLITDAITKMPQGFVHRDFQSRNILFHHYEFYLIDFQDALQGPVLYDLVALLRDSYIDFSPSETDRLLRYYHGILPDKHPYHGRYEALVNDFHLITLQRKLKDAGRFQYIKTVRGNANFIEHIPLTLRYVRDAFAALPKEQELFTQLKKYLQ